MPALEILVERPSCTMRSAQKSQYDSSSIATSCALAHARKAACVLSLIASMPSQANRMLSSCSDGSRRLAAARDAAICNMDWGGGGEPQEFTNFSLVKNNWERYFVDPYDAAAQWCQLTVRMSDAFSHNPGILFRLEPHGYT